MRRPIYLDYMATTPIDVRVIDKMLHYMGVDSDFGNPASIIHLYGQRASQAIEEARVQIASAIGADAEEIIFTSGATEANNLALLGAARFYQHKGRHIVTMSTEHRAVLDTLRHLEKEGFEVTYLMPQADGLLALSDLERALRKDTILVSIMHVNHEIGVIQDIAAIADRLRGQGILFHVDAAQSAGKLPLDVHSLGVDLLSLSAHKVYGPKGVGALYLRKKPRIRIQPQSFGGGQEQGVRSGTLATHQIVGMGEAFAISHALRIEEQSRILQLRERLWQGIQHLPGIQLNGHPELRIAGNLNVSFVGWKGDLISQISHDIASSTVSACASALSQASYVLLALGVPTNVAIHSLRLSLGRFTTEAEIQSVVHILSKKLGGEYEPSTTT